MAEKITLKIAASLAHLVRPETPREEKLRAIRGETAAAGVDRATLLFFLCHDRDQELRGAARAALQEMPEAEVAELVRAEQLHPQLLAFFGRLHWHSPAIVKILLERGDLPPETLAFLRERIAGPTGGESPPRDGQEVETGGAPAEDAEEEPAEEEELDEESVEFRSKYQLAQVMGTGEKIKMALTGDKEWRSLLLKDANKLVSGGVVKNPRITEAEVLAITKSAIQNDEIIRVICTNKEWVKNYQIRKALVENHRTPLPVALRFLGTLTEKDLAGLAKSKNVNTVISNQARRTLINKKKD